MNDKEGTLQSLANREKYTWTSATITNGVAVYVLTLHNVSVSDNGTRFECFVRSSGRRRITSGTRVLRVEYKGEDEYIVCILCVHPVAYLYVCSILFLVFMQNIHSINLQFCMMYTVY